MFKGHATLQCILPGCFKTLRKYKQWRMHARLLGSKYVGNAFEASAPPDPHIAEFENRFAAGRKREKRRKIEEKGDKKGREKGHARPQLLRQ